MKNKFYTIFYDFFAIFIVNIIFLSFVEINNLIEISLTNLIIIFVLFLINFYKKSPSLRINYKIFIILSVFLIHSTFKIFFFGKVNYFEFILSQDLILLILFLIPRIFLNINEFNLNFIKNYNFSRKGVLVIGGLGYIGSGVVQDLLSKDEKVSVLDCCMYGDNVLKKFQNYKNFNFVKGYASDILLLSKLLRENSKVVHLAGLVGDPACALNEKDTIYFNIKTTNIIKNLCHEYDIQRLIFASSCSVYGKTDKLCYEDSPTNPVSLYATTKLDSERELMESKLDTKILRFSTIFGPAERLRFDLVVNLFIAQAFYEKKITVFGGNQVRPFLHVKDASKSILNFLNHKITNKQDIYNIGFNELNGTINQVAQLIEKNIQGSEITLSAENVDARNYAVSFEKYNNLFKNEKYTSIEESIKEFIEIFEKKQINFKDKIYNNLLTTRSFINDNKININDINKILYE